MFLLKKRCLVATTFFALTFSVKVTVAQATITIDHHTQKFIGEVSTFDRGKYVIGHFGGTDSDPNFVAFKKAYNLAPNFQAGRRFSSPLQAIDPVNKVPPLSTIQRKYSGTRSIVPNSVATSHPRDIFAKYDKAGFDYVTEDVTTYFSDLSTYVAQAYQMEMEELPEFFEPINEPFVHAADCYLGKDRKQDDVIITKMSEVYRALGRAIRALPALDSMKIVGYSNAWPEFEINDFANWRRSQKRFMDIAGAEMDGFSIHTYDHSIGAFGSGKNSSGGIRSGANVEAVLDMVENYSYERFGRVKPIAMTEYGQLVVDAPHWNPKGGNTKFNYTPTINSQAVRSQLHMAMAFMERGADISIAIPFTTGKTTNFDAKYMRAGLWIQQADGRFELTPRKFFFEVWKDIKGNRVNISSDNIDIQTQAFVDDRHLYVVLNNLNHQTQKLTLQLLDNADIQQVAIKRIKIPHDRPATMTNIVPKTPPTALAIDYGETIVLTYTFDKPIIFQRRLKTQKYYAGNTLRPIQANEKLTYQLPEVQLKAKGMATARVSIGRTLDKNRRPILTVNGHPIDYPKDVIRGYDQSSRKNFFGTLEIPVPYQHLKNGDNEVQVVFSDDGGHVSSVILQVGTFE